ncbi:hypothetical protein BHE90_001309 [Fusarium euwallaceae]|uniref:Uncharacterized protein n=1 Tax=Fusarium euwallaceae TaxID=1147111 RepID=A0A430M878_9HYPO|nr:hypothetical protein BHE90_001309 [Fusarium euwallaceae]
MVNCNWRLRVYGPPAPAAPARCYPNNLRWVSPNAISEHSPPGRTLPPGGPQRQQLHLPAPPPNLRSPAHPPRHRDLRGAHSDDGHIIYKKGSYSQDPHHNYSYRRLPFRPPPLVSHQNYSHLTGGIYEVPPVRPGNPTRVKKGAPRKRASIACQACRHRKVCVEDLLGDTGD